MFRLRRRNLKRKREERIQLPQFNDDLLFSIYNFLNLPSLLALRRTSTSLAYSGLQFFLSQHKFTEARLQKLFRIHPSLMGYGWKFIHSLEEVLSPSFTAQFPFLQTITFAPTFSNQLYFTLAPTLVKITLNASYDQPFRKGVLPSSLRYLKIGRDYQQFFVKGALPEGLETLILGWEYNQPLSYLPATLRRLELGGKFNLSLAGILPPFLTYLKLSFFFQNRLRSGDLPGRLRVLSINRSYPFPLEKGILPPYLELLYYRVSKPFPLDGVLPSFLLQLELPPEYNFPFAKNTLPSSLKVLWTGDHFTAPLIYLPEGLEKLCVGVNYFHPFLHFPSGLRCLDLITESQRSLLPHILPEKLQVRVLISV